MDSSDFVHVRTSTAGREGARAVTPKTLTVVWAGLLGGTATVPVLAGGLDDAMARVAPRLVVDVTGLGTAVATPTTLAGLRASRLARALPAVQALLALATSELEGAGPEQLAATGAPADWVQKALASRQAADEPGSAVDRLMQLTGQAPASFQAEVEAEVARAERAVADDPEAAAFERAWRSLAWLARRLDLRGGVRLVAVTDASLDALLAGDALASAAADASLVVVDAGLGPSARDVGRAGRLAAIGAQAGAPVVASAAPALVGTDGRHGAVPPLRHATDAAFAGWELLRQQPEARALGLAFPEVRLAPGRDDLWGGGALAVAADAAAAWARGDGLPGLGRQAVPDLGADDLGVALGPAVAADLARGGICTLAPDGTRARVVGAPSAAASGASPARDAALSLPAALFAARLGRALSAGGDPAEALGRELDGHARLDALPDGLRAVLPASASPTLGADVAVRVQTQAP